MVRQGREMARGPLAHEVTQRGTARDSCRVIAGNACGVSRSNIVHRVNAEQVALFDIETSGKGWVAVGRNRLKLRPLDELVLTWSAGRPKDEKSSPTGSTSASLRAPGRDRPIPGGHA